MTLADRVLSRCMPIPECGCMVFMGALNTNGYAVIRDGGDLHLGHVVTWEAKNGPVPTGRELGHTCGVESCCEETHVRPITHRANMLEGWRNPSARNILKTHCDRGHTFDAENTYHPPEKPHHRRCRACERERLARSRANRRNKRLGEPK
jgi:hypothetical protein